MASLFYISYLAAISRFRKLNSAELNNLSPISRAWKLIQEEGEPMAIRSTNQARGSAMFQLDDRNSNNDDVFLSGWRPLEVD
jgi:hypothetical protein